MQISNRWRKILRIITLSLLILLSILYVFFIKSKITNFSKRKVCSDIVFNVKNDKNGRFVSEKEVAKILEQRGINPIGKLVYKIRTGKIESAVEELSVVENVECYKLNNGNIRIDIKQRTPVFKVVSLSNYYIDSKRHKMPISNNYTIYIPVVTGDVSLKMAQNELFDFVMFVRENEFWDNFIVQINVTKKEEIELVPRVGEHIIKLGKLTNYKIKLKKLEKFYKEGLNRIGWDKYRIIDVRFKNQVVCR